LNVVEERTDDCGLHAGGTGGHILSFNRDIATGSGTPELAAINPPWLVKCEVANGSMASVGTILPASIGKNNNIIVGNIVFSQSLLTGEFAAVG